VHRIQPCSVRLSQSDRRGSFTRLSAVSSQLISGFSERLSAGWLQLCKLRALSHTAVSHVQATSLRTTSHKLHPYTHHSPQATTLFAPQPTSHIPSHHSPQATSLRTTAHKPHPYAPQPTSHIPTRREPKSHAQTTVSPCRAGSPLVCFPPLASVACSILPLEHATSVATLTQVTTHWAACNH
jgi:hypothetical protein